MKNVFIEGIQGAGKSTLVQEIATRAPQFKVCREGDYSPVELAWCAWLTEAEYAGILDKYAPVQSEIRKYTVKEGERYIVCYTRILTDIPGFHKDLERYEIYNGRKSLQELEQIVLSRYEKFSGNGYVFECSIFQNIVEDMILFHHCSDDEIVDFYHKLYSRINQKDFVLLYLYSEEIEENIRVIKKERSDNQGNEMWYPLMLKYFIHSPYGQQNGCKDFEDLIAHFKHRQQVELRVIKEVIGERARLLPSKGWKTEEILDLIR